MRMIFQREYARITRRLNKGEFTQTLQVDLASLSGSQSIELCRMIEKTVFAE